jgi:hypothetical protein
MAKTSRNSRIWQIERASTTCVLFVVLVTVFCASAQTQQASHGETLKSLTARLVHNKRQMRAFAATENSLKHSKQMKNGEYEQGRNNSEAAASVVLRLQP